MTKTEKMLQRLERMSDEELLNIILQAAADSGLEVKRADEDGGVYIGDKKVDDVSELLRFLLPEELM